MVSCVVCLLSLNSLNCVSIFFPLSLSLPSCLHGWAAAGLLSSEELLSCLCPASLGLFAACVPKSIKESSVTPPTYSHWVTPVLHSGTYITLSLNGPTSNYRQNNPLCFGPLCKNIKKQFASWAIEWTCRCCGQASVLRWIVSVVERLKGRHRRRRRNKRRNTESYQWVSHARCTWKETVPQRLGSACNRQQQCRVIMKVIGSILLQLGYINGYSTLLRLNICNVECALECDYF